MSSVLANDLLRVIPELIGEGEAESGKNYLNRPMTCPIFRRSSYVVLKIHLFKHCSGKGERLLLDWNSENLLQYQGSMTA